MADMKTLQRISTYVNAALMGFVVFALLFYKQYGITYMYYHSMPTLACYVVFFILIRKGMLTMYAGAVYIVLALYMAAGNICLGYNAGFHLYCISLIPLSFYMVYMAVKLKIRKINPLVTSFVLIGIYLVSTVYVVMKGPVYEIDKAAICSCLVVNSIAVFCFLVGYAGFTIKLVMTSEDKLTEMANTDRLTGLFNRNYMMTHMNEIQAGDPSGLWVAIVDIDDFKKINDTYGHSCGDYVLREIARAMREVCRGCTACRWGGEEFLILSDTSAAQPALLEQLRQRVQDTPFSYQGRDFSVTITAGVSAYWDGMPLDGWVRDADDKLYRGKSSNKNQVVY